ncbi:terpene synthase family protein [Streptomyces vinaceus]|uniref:terpene synthase family protein n=1 Tax=Streptomyces vinaceus TaxID=1960 RepID=UPI0036931938
MFPVTTITTAAGVSGFTLPSIYMPIAPRSSPHTERAAAELDAWLVRSGLGSSSTARQWVTREEHVRLAALTMPDASAQTLPVIAQWYSWLFAFDDLFDLSEIGRDRRRSSALIEGAVGVLPADGGAGACAPASPVEWGLADLWRRTATGMPPTWRERFTGHLRAYLRSYTLEIDNRLDGIRTGDIVGYLDMRRDAGATRTVFDLIEFAQGIEVPAPAHGSAVYQGMLLAAVDTVCITNDIFSYSKERQAGEESNVLYIAERFLGCTPQRAVEFVNDLQTTRMKSFERLQQRLGQVHDLCPRHRHETEAGVSGLRSWIRGNLDWSRTTRRYAPDVDTWGGSRRGWMHEISGLNPGH